MAEVCSVGGSEKGRSMWIMVSGTSLFFVCIFLEIRHTGRSEKIVYGLQ